MSWYFLGGFSAYLRVPSGRCSNHSGCSVSQGWSAEHWMAKSRAMSSPSRRASATMRSKAASSPSSGCRVVWPPSTPPTAQGLPGSSGPAVRVLLRPLRLVTPMGWTGREVDDVEAQLGQGRELGPSRRRSRPRTGGTSRTRTPKAGPDGVDVDLERPGPGGRPGCGRGGGPPRPPRRRSSGRLHPAPGPTLAADATASAAARRVRSVVGVRGRPGPRWPARPPRSAAGASPRTARRRGRPGPASTLRSHLDAPRRQLVGPGLDGPGSSGPAGRRGRTPPSARP